MKNQIAKNCLTFIALLLCFMHTTFAQTAQESSFLFGVWDGYVSVKETDSRVVTKPAEIIIERDYNHTTPQPYSIDKRFTVRFITAKKSNVYVSGSEAYKNQVRTTTETTLFGGNFVVDAAGNVAFNVDVISTGSNNLEYPGMYARWTPVPTGGKVSVIKYNQATQELVVSREDAPILLAVISGVKLINNGASPNMIDAVFKKRKFD